MSRGRVEKRGAQRRAVKPVMLIVTEGSQTEPKYFDYYRTRRTNIDIQVLGSKDSGGDTDYLSLVRKAIHYIDKNELSAAHGDTMWVVADGDINYNNPDPVKAKTTQLDKARKMAAKAGIMVAISNPCFEFWYLLHFKYTTGHLRDYDAVADALRNYIPDYEKSSDVAQKLAQHLDEALVNAERVEQYHVKNGSAAPFSLDINPFTEVYRLVRACRGL